ncbi:hypothetical protein NPA31_005275 [Aurantimonas sp. MSK8Z-1]|uniref:hypothetical protein n=1 Tax=Mangrovibrevibacter kandeliae TaxID=2968473 RepID=UPI0021189A51|nr:hypothetical protein [Aurantimonas sp. MSK8Z-1]MCW4114373.1 hypothetical protein [Aurantimonas sp. MSK8Z-1]
MLKTRTDAALSAAFAALICCVTFPVAASGFAGSAGKLLPFFGAALAAVFVPLATGRSPLRNQIFPIVALVALVHIGLTCIWPGGLLTSPDLTIGIIGFALIVGVALLRFVVPRPATCAAEIALLIGTAAILYGLIDRSWRMDTVAYGPYLGPAVDVAYGRVPFLETYSQYGSNFLLYVPVVRAFPTSLSALVVLTNAINILYFGLFCYVAATATRSALASFLVAFGVVAFISAYPFDINYTPSVFGMRFLPLALLLASIVGRWPRPVHAALTLIAAVWSIESLLYALVLNTAAGVYDRLAGRSLSVRLILISGAASSAVVIGQAVLCLALAAAAYLAWFGSLPDLKPYLELVFVYADASRIEWLTDVGDRSWITFVPPTIYCAALATSVALAENDPRTARSLGSIAVVGLLCYSYFLLRSTIPLFYQVIAPSLVLLAWLLVYGMRRLVARLDLWLASASVFASAGLFAFLGATAYYMVFVQPAPYSNPGQWEGSRTMLAPFCVQAGDCVPHLPQVRDAAPFSDQDSFSSSDRDIARQAYHAIVATEASGSRAFAFINDAPALYHALQRPIPFDGSNPINDQYSETLLGRSLDALSHGVAAGDVIVAPNEDEPKPYRPLLEKLLSRFCGEPAHDPDLPLIRIFRLRDC